MSVTEIYEREVKPLPAADRIRLATLILNDIAPQGVADYSTEWSEQDITEFTSQNWNRQADGDRDVSNG